MFQQIKDDVEIIFNRLKTSRENANQYHTLANSLREIIKITYFNLPQNNRLSENNIVYFKEVLQKGNEELSQLSKHKTVILEKGDYQSYHKIIKSYQDLSRIQGELKWAFNKQ